MMLRIEEAWCGACGNSELSSQFFCKCEGVLNNNVC